MKCGARVALGVAGGYLLGRTKKMKLALMLGGMAAGRSAGGPGGLLAQGARLIAGSPELSKLTDEIKARLLDAGKQAAVAAASRQIEGLTDRVTQRTTSLGEAAARRGRKTAEKPADEEPVDTDEAEAAAEPEETAGDRAEETSREKPSGPSAPARRRGAAEATRSRGRAVGTVRRAAGGPGTATPPTSRASTGRGTRPTRTRRSEDDR